MDLFQRKELITMVSMEKLFRVKNALSEAGIENFTKTRGVAGFASNRRHGVPFIDQDSAYTYTVYVRKDDYHRAVAAVQPALRNG